MCFMGLNMGLNRVKWLLVYAASTCGLSQNSLELVPKIRDVTQEELTKLSIAISRNGTPRPSSGGLTRTGKNLGLGR